MIRKLRTTGTLIRASAFAILSVAILPPSIAMSTQNPSSITVERTLTSTWTRDKIFDSGRLVVVRDVKRTGTSSSSSDMPSKYTLRVSRQNASYRFSPLRQIAKSMGCGLPWQKKLVKPALDDRGHRNGDWHVFQSPKCVNTILLWRGQRTYEVLGKLGSKIVYVHETP